MLRPRLVNALLVAASVLVALVIVEVGLRLAGFSFDVAPDSVEFGWPDPESLEDLYVADDDLFWIPLDYQAKLEGFRENRPDIVFMGDSCTESAWGQYPRMFLEKLRARVPHRPIVGDEVGVGGWSSYQGLQQLRRDLVPLQPRVVTVYYGWNDHWLAFGIGDRELHELVANFSGWDRLRLSQLLLKARLSLLPKNREEWPRRVPPDEFEENLRQIVRAARETGIVPVLVTAPSAHRPGLEPVELADRWMTDLNELIPLHRRYVAIVRKVAASEDAVLCDLAQRYDSVPMAERVARYFTEDGIHFTEAGDDRLADYLLDCFAADAELHDLFF